MRLRRQALAAAALAVLLRVAGAAPSDDADDAALLADADYAAGLVSLKAGDAATALARFQSALRRFPDAADLHNELGFAHRQVGQLDKAFQHYKRALSINPLHRGAHEYIGEAYLMAGDVASAEKHLASLRSICVLPCEELNSLGRSIARHRAQATPR
ncbi:MAG TPA: tetratricopeptide repeat protein [Burkholderiaceae bacterium]|jgi:tetratricopeptide (TPR) repeat protein|nr:tetratricopeptide repeat protein [Burkholderiaceae bacterium]